MDAEQRQKLESQLSAYIDGELTDAERAEAETSLAQDAQARQLLAELRATVAGLRALPRAKASGDLIEDVRTRLERQALLDSDQPTGAMMSAAPSFGRRWIAAAAVIALAFVAGLVLWSFTDQKTRQRHNQFAMHTPAEAPPDATVVREERHLLTRGAAPRSDKSVPLAEGGTDTDIHQNGFPGTTPLPAKHLADRGVEEEKGQPIMHGKVRADTRTSSQDDLALISPQRQLVEQSETMRRGYPEEKEKESKKDFALGISTAPADGTHVVVGRELQVLPEKQQAASQPQQQPSSSGCYIANRPVKIGDEYKALWSDDNFFGQAATQPATMPCRGASTKSLSQNPEITPARRRCHTGLGIGTKPSSTQPAVSTQPAPPTQPASTLPVR